MELHEIGDKEQAAKKYFIGKGFQSLGVERNEL